MSLTAIHTIAEDYNLVTERPENAVHSASADSLLEPEAMRIFIGHYETAAKAVDLEGAAGFFAYTVVNFMLAQQQLISAHNSALQLRPAQLTFHLVPTEKSVAVKFGLHGSVLEDAPADEDTRSAWLMNVYNRFYGELIRPLFESLATATGISIVHLWQHLATKFNYVPLRADGLDGALKQRMIDDYEQLKYKVDPAIFGRSKNPIDAKLRYVESMADSDKQVLMKNGCCYYYKMEASEGSYCFTCPRISDKEREQRRESCRSGQTSQ
ncbi:hypothetical protein GOM71_13895 [Paenibacillus sp. NEAU-GSW1]|nr:hypothetical protein [Paenibacillus sp. NEAU-GSW1]